VRRVIAGPALRSDAWAARFCDGAEVVSFPVEVRSALLFGDFGFVAEARRFDIEQTLQAVALSLRAVGENATRYGFA